MSESTEAITRLLERAGQGDAASREALFERVHDRLRDIARRQMRAERPEHTLQPTALVNEAYLELFAGQAPCWNDRNHFFAYAARVMRHVLVHHARARSAQKRGGDQLRVTLSGLSQPQRGEDLLALDEALDRLAAVDKRKSDIVQMRFFSGLTIEEIGQVTDLSPATIHSELKLARGWLYDAMDAPGPS